MVIFFFCISYNKNVEQCGKGNHSHSKKKTEKVIEWSLPRLCVRWRINLSWESLGLCSWLLGGISHPLECSAYVFFWELWPTAFEYCLWERMETKGQSCGPYMTKPQQNLEHQGPGRIPWLARRVRITMQCGWKEELASVTLLGEGDWGRLRLDPLCTPYPIHLFPGLVLTYPFTVINWIHE